LADLLITSNIVVRHVITFWGQVVLI